MLPAPKPAACLLEQCGFNVLSDSHTELNLFRVTEHFSSGNNKKKKKIKTMTYLNEGGNIAAFEELIHPHLRSRPLSGLEPGKV